MFRKSLITALIVLMSAGTVLAKVPLDAPSQRDAASARHVLGEQTGPKRALRFKATRPVNLRKSAIERAWRARIG
ncbi:hypothetical protein [Bosea vaviloviae]|uniref:Uncharacterized protein n=1 Tax=Bosea vaviloviae TaxID=1526658 RepID=A0A0N1F5E6_9HYPH|nr:hypothetical protein [Bosea vaviloviae]KPH81028.1 hypothetical protein AE618_10295 [Bosea vaviloviae]